MTTLIERVAFRYLQAERVGDPKELLPLFERAVSTLADAVPESKIHEAKEALESRVQAGTPVDAKELAIYYDTGYSALFAVKHGQRKVAEPGHQLFLSILQVYALPPALRKKVEIASRLYLKEMNPRYKNKYGAPGILERIQVYEKYRDLLRAHVDIAKEAVAKGKDHAEEGEGSTKLRVGPFTLVNTGGFDSKQMGEVAEVVHKVTAFLQSSGLGEVCYGEVQVTNTISKARVLAFYLIASDELFIRANVKASSDVVRTVLHELGHRYEHKFLKGSHRDLEVLYQRLSGQETKRKYDTLKSKLPAPGETMVSKGKTYVVRGTQLDTKWGYKILLNREDDPKATATIGIDGWLEMKGESARDVDADPNYLGFVTDYAKRGGPSENFAEMFAYYCVGKLPAGQKPLFEDLISGKSLSRLAPMAARVAARFKEARQLHLPVVYIPSQTNIGFSVFVPHPKDAEDLGRALNHSRLLGHGRIRVQKSYMLDAVELHWVPSGTMPSLHEFTHEVEAWTRRNGYALARDMRQLRQGLDALRS